MRIELTKKPARRGLLALLFMVLGALVATAAPASAATGTDGFTILNALYNQGVHQCTVFGAADGYQAVACVDITTGVSDGDADYYATGQLEIYCQTDAGVTVECANMYAEGVFANGAGGRDDVGSYACGHGYGACPSGRKYLVEGTYTYTNNGYADNDCYDGPNSSYDVWTVAYDYNTQVELPVSDTTVELTASPSTGHYYICPNY